MINEQVKNILEWIICIIVAVLLGLWIRYYIMTPTQVQSISMEPTLVQGQRLILNRNLRLSKKMPQRGQIITFEAPAQEYLTEKDLEKSPTAIYKESKGFQKFMHNVLEIGKISYIKRVIALPGEHVKIQDGKVFINDKELDESEYLSDSIKTETLGGLLVDFTVPEQTVFAMGDNRPNSHDCRAFGCIPLEKIESVVLCRIWPMDKLGKVK